MENNDAVTQRRPIRLGTAATAAGRHAIGPVSPRPMPYPHSALHASLLLLPSLLLPGPASSQAATQTAPPDPAQAAPAVPTETPAAAMPPTATPALPTPPVPVAAPSAGSMPTSAQQAVLDRIRRLRDGDQRRFGSCSYRWDRWKLLADGSRTTSYSCENTQIVDRTIGVNCSKLQINSYDPVPPANGKGEAWAWGSWRLPQAGGEEQMVATLCANALPAPATTEATRPTSPPSPQTPPPAKR